VHLFSSLLSVFSSLICWFSNYSTNEREHSQRDKYSAVVKNGLASVPAPVAAGLRIIRARPKHHSRSTSLASTALIVLLSFRVVL
jgi:hypothetical protein